MKEYKNGNEAAIIILHEIYGINRFIEEVCIQYHNDGFDVFCPQLLGKENFTYEESSSAYLMYSVLNCLAKRTSLMKRAQVPTLIFLMKSVLMFIKKLKNK